MNDRRRWHHSPRWRFSTCACVPPRITQKIIQGGGGQILSLVEDALRVGAEGGKSHFSVRPRRIDPRRVQQQQERASQGVTPVGAQPSSFFCWRPGSGAPGNDKKSAARCPPVLPPQERCRREGLGDDQVRPGACCCHLPAFPVFAARFSREVSSPRPLRFGPTPNLQAPEALSG